MEDAVYLDEEGNKVDASAVGSTHEVVGQGGSPKTQGSDVYSRMAQEERVNNFISQTSPTQSLTSINYMLRGYVFNEAEKAWQKVSEELSPLIRLDFIQFITPDLSENVRMTNLSPQQINGIMDSVIEWVYDYLKYARKGVIEKKEELVDGKPISQSMISCIVKHRAGYTPDEISQIENLSEEEVKKILALEISREVTYKVKPIKDYNQLQKISLMMIKAVFYTLLRAQNGIEKSQMFKSLTMGETLNPDQLNNRKGFLENFKFWK